MDKRVVLGAFLGYLDKVEDEGSLLFQNHHTVNNYFCAASEPDENNVVQVVSLELRSWAVHQTEHDVSNSATRDPVANAIEQGLDDFYAKDAYLDLKNKKHLDLTEEAGITKETRPDKAFFCFDNLVDKYFVDKPETPKDGQFQFGGAIVFRVDMEAHLHVIVSEKNPEGVVRTLIYNTKVPYVRMVDHEHLDPDRDLSCSIVGDAVIHSLDRLHTKKGYKNITEEAGITPDMIGDVAWNE